MDKEFLDIEVTFQLPKGEKYVFTERAIKEHDIQHHVFALIDLNRKLWEYFDGKAKIVDIKIS